MGDPVRQRLDQGVATVTLDRPDALNSLDIATKEALLAAVRAAADDDAVRCVVLGATGRGFCVGQDLREHATRLESVSNEEVWSTVDEHYSPLVRAIAEMPKPVIAAVGGIAAGAGLSLALACDFRIAADSATFTTAFAGIGLSCDTGSSWTLPRLVGRARALELLLLPGPVTADEALRLGLVTRVVPAADVDAEAATLAARLAAGPTLAYGAIKEAVNHGASHTLEESLAVESAMMARTGASDDHRRAVTAFLAKRQPEFTGR